MDIYEMNGKKEVEFIMKKNWLRIVICGIVCLLLQLGRYESAYAFDFTADDGLIIYSGDKKDANTDEYAEVTFSDSEDDTGIQFYYQFFKNGGVIDDYEKYDFDELMKMKKALQKLSEEENKPRRRAIWEPRYEWEFDLIDGPIDERISSINRVFNRQLEKNLEGYIFGQRVCSHFYIGKESRMADVGCELAAVYNVFQFHDMKRKISDIIYDAEQEGYIMKEGAYGTNPFKLNNLIDDLDSYCRLSIEQYKAYDEFYDKLEDSMSTDQIFIVSFWNDYLHPSEGVHTIAIYSKEGCDILYALNNKTNWDVEEEIHDFEEICKKNTFIVGYWVYKR